MSDTRFKSFIAVAIAFVTILGASAACLASVALSTAGDADFDGMSAAISAQREEVVNHVEAYGHLRAFTAYRRYLELGNILWDQALQTDADTAETLNRQRRDIWGLASAMRFSFFLPRFESEDGTYDVRRELAEARAEDAQSYDLESAPHFKRADLLRQRSSYLVADMIVFAVSFWFLTLANITESRIKYVWAALGIACGLAGILGIPLAGILT